MKPETEIGVDMAKGPDRTITFVRDSDGRYRHATEEETLRFRRQAAYYDMKGRLTDETVK